MSGTNESPHAKQLVAAQISTAVVGILHRYTGRGPTTARTAIDENLVTVVLSDMLTKGERSLVDDGRGELVIEMRQAYQQTMRHELTAGVEELTGRGVIAFMSANHLDPDIAIESFVLQPSTTSNDHRGSDA